MSAREPRKRQPQRRQPPRRKPPKRRLPRRPIGVPRRGGVTLAQQGRSVLPRGRASNLPRGAKVIRAGLRGKRGLAQQTVRRAQFAQRTGIPQQTFGSGEFRFPKLRGLPRRTQRMDGLGL